MQTTERVSRLDARLLWSLIPGDCKPALTKLSRAGLGDVAKEEILRDAQVMLQRIDKPNAFDFAFALESAAQNWLWRHKLP